MCICKINQIKENKPKRTKTIQQTIEDPITQGTNSKNNKC